MLKPSRVTRVARPLGRRTFATVQDPPVRRYGGLRDQDRIFTNAHSCHDFSIKGAMARGDWYRTKDIILKGDAWIIYVLEDPQPGLGLVMLRFLDRDGR
ncbi:hypothetical protein K488DRAFT_84503 [Vararia minispora EC-137]|uniref:Uncharacterized protein n=1 Tax=Vararia minispora EC-137 TaxID=1314806 RepID=A0ACB8QQC2_9AGAM|nr:hypothetical protein K488DRAFT_84503 [Vararia minispora EC-137]